MLWVVVLASTSTMIVTVATARKWPTVSNRLIAGVATATFGAAVFQAITRRFHLLTLLLMVWLVLMLNTQLGRLWLSRRRRGSRSTRRG